MIAPQLKLANFLWTGYYSSIYVNASNRDRMAPDEGASAGAVLFLQGVPSAPHFRFSSEVFVSRLKSPLAISPTSASEWGHVCNKGIMKTLMEVGCHCAKQGQAYATHAAMLGQLREMLKAAKCDYGWMVFFFNKGRQRTNKARSQTKKNGFMAILYLKTVKWSATPVKKRTAFKTCQYEVLMDFFF